MALTIEEADIMIEECKNSGSTLSIYENFLFAPHILKAKELIDSDYIGDPSSIRIKIAMGGKGIFNDLISSKLILDWTAGRESLSVCIFPTLEFSRADR